MKILNQDPFIAFKEDFLTSDELLFMLNKNTFEKSTVFGNGNKVEIANARTSETYQDLNDDLRPIREKVFNILSSVGFDYPFENYEGMQLIKYEEGQEFVNHYDFLNIDPNNKIHKNERVGTVIIYLKQPISGGRTIFNNLDIAVESKNKGLLFFRYDGKSRNETLHTGEKVLEGTKIIATMFIRESRW